MQSPQPGGKLRPRHQLKPARHLLHSKRASFGIISPVQARTSVRAFVPSAKPANWANFRLPRGCRARKRTASSSPFGGDVRPAFPAGRFPAALPPGKRKMPLPSGLCANGRPAGNAAPRCAAKFPYSAAARASRLHYARPQALGKAPAARKDKKVGFAGLSARGYGLTLEVEGKQGDGLVGYACSTNAGSARSA